MTLLTDLVDRPANVAFALSYLNLGANMADKRDMATEGLKDELKGTAKQVEGRIRSAVGGASGDTGEQLKGKGQEIKGKVQQKFGRAKQDADPEPGVDEE